jgi:hypothetical protein
MSNVRNPTELWPNLGLFATRGTASVRIVD